MNGRKRKRLEREFAKLHNAAAPTTEWQERAARPAGEKDRPQFYVRSIRRALKKRPAEFGIGQAGRDLLLAKLHVAQSLLARQPLPAETVKAAAEEPEP